MQDSSMEDAENLLVQNLWRKLLKMMRGNPNLELVDISEFVEMGFKRILYDVRTKIN